MSRKQATAERGPAGVKDYGHRRGLRSWRVDGAGMGRKLNYVATNRMFRTKLGAERGGY